MTFPNLFAYLFGICLSLFSEGLRLRFGKAKANAVTDGVLFEVRDVPVEHHEQGAGIAKIFLLFVFFP